MSKFWKYTVGLLVEVIIKVLQIFVPKDNNTISGTGSHDSK